MRFIAKIIFQTLSNTLALLAAAYFVPNFTLSGNTIFLIILGFSLMLINLTVKPFLKLFFGPLIILTLGLFLIVINAFGLILLDFFSPNLTIQGYLPLFLGTVIVGAANFVLSLIGKIFLNKEE